MSRDSDMGLWVCLGSFWNHSGARRDVEERRHGKRERWNMSCLEGHSQELYFYSGDDSKASFLLEGGSELSFKKVAPVMV